MQPFAAEIERVRRGRDVGERAPSHSPASLEDDHAPAGLHEPARRCNASGAGANDDDIGIARKVHRR